MRLIYYIIYITSAGGCGRIILFCSNQIKTQYFAVRCSFSLTANAAFLGLLAADAGIQPTTNRQWAASQIDYMLGNNPRGSSYVVGFGTNYPKQPHHGGA